MFKYFDSLFKNYIIYYKAKTPYEFNLRWYHELLVKTQCHLKVSTNDYIDMIHGIPMITI